VLAIRQIAVKARRNPLSTIFGDTPEIAPVTTFLDLFCGAGGLSLGLVQAGWEPLLGVDNCPHAVETYHRNFQHPVLLEDIEKLDPRKLRDILNETPDWVAALSGLLHRWKASEEGSTQSANARFCTGHPHRSAEGILG
jgi:ribosomal protein L11 methylase PrmA